LLQRWKKLNTEQLRAAQLPLKQLYKDEPEKANWVLNARGTLNQSRVTCRIETVLAKVEAGLHPATGGDGKDACSGEMLLESLAACAGVTLTAVATAMGITLSKGDVHVAGDLDFRGTLGLSKEVPVGFSNIRIRFDIESDATSAQLASLIKLTERYCVIYQTLINPPAISVEINS
jgi:uncharacterized OsmC-like protein